MTKIEQRRKLIEAARPGPWISESSGIKQIDGGDEYWIGEFNTGTYDTDLVAAAVNDYAALLEVARQAKDNHTCNTYIPMTGATLYCSMCAALAKFEEKP